MTKPPLFTEEQIMSNLIDASDLDTKTFDYSDSNGNECIIDIYLPDRSISVYCADHVLYTFSKMYNNTKLNKIIKDINNFFQS